MLILKPVKDSFLSQGFGENKAFVKVDADGIPYRPFRVTNSRVGTIPFYKAIGMKGHNGRDETTYFKAPCYFPVIGATEWTARHAGDMDGGIGLDVFSKSRVKILELPPETGTQARKDWEANDGFMYVKFRFWHAQSNQVPDNSDVTYGQLIQFCDSTGASSGHHLHWGMKFVDGNRTTFDKDNGYFGAVSFGNRYQDDFILDVLNRKETLTPQQTLYKMAWGLRHIDRKTAEILKSVAKIMETWGIASVGTLFKTKKK